MCKTFLEIVLVELWTVLDLTIVFVLENFESCRAKCFMKSNGTNKTLKNSESRRLCGNPQETHQEQNFDLANYKLTIIIIIINIQERVIGPRSR